MQDLITGKNILLICYPFFGYDEAIKEELYNLGANHVFLKKAEYFPSSPRDEQFLAPWYKAPLYYIKAPNARTKWTEQLKREIEGMRFNVLLVIENTCFKKSFIKYLREKNPEIKTIWFLWDTFKTQQRWHRDYIPLFDKVYSFDRDDAKKYNLKYFPDFYVESNGEEQIKYDICFIGTAHENDTPFRIAQLATIKEQCDGLGLKSFFHLKYDEPKTHHPIKKILKRYRNSQYSQDVNRYRHLNFMQSDTLSLHSVNQVMHNSSIILDLNYTNRQGLTINAITAIASGKKLITTNERIKEEEFYNPNNILVIDSQYPLISEEFICSEYIPINMQQLRLDNWLKHIINS